MIGIYHLRTVLLSTVALLPPAMVMAQPVLPTGGTFQAGQGSIGSSGNAMTVNQSSPRGVIDWKSFSIGAGGTVQFNNGSGATLNRVTGGSLSEILGSLKATGSLYLINPQGVVIGETGVVATGGTFAASTLDIANDHFMAGGTLVFRGDSTASVKNLGSISSTGGDVLLIARNVVNQGKISAPNGTAALASGQEVLVSDNTSSSERVFVRVGTTNGSVETSGLIEAAQAELKAAGGNIYALAGNNGGAVRATGTATRAGRVWLTADGGNVETGGKISAVNADGSGGEIAVSATKGMATHTGTLSASGTNGGKITVTADRVVNQGRIAADGSSGDGGRVEITYGRRYIDTSTAKTTAKGSGGAGGALTLRGNGTLFASGQFDATGDTAGGAVDLFGDSLSLAAAAVDVSGGSGGGTIRVGGDYQGAGDAPHAKTTLVTAATTLKADALQTGTGGRVIVWSDEKTEFAGTITAQGIRSDPGDGLTTNGGGFVEVSSKDSLLFAGAVTAATLLLDPKNITISDSASYPQFELIDPAPSASNKFGRDMVVLENGNVVVSSPFDNTGGIDAGAVYLFNGSTGALISTLMGSHDNDKVGAGGVTALTGNNNYVISSPFWSKGYSGPDVEVGAATWVNGTTGLAGTVSGGNSLIGSLSGDHVSAGGVVALTNGNYVVVSPDWANGSTPTAGATTWGNGATGITGSVSDSNSLVGSKQGDQVGSAGVVALANGNYVVVSPLWTYAGIPTVGAVTWGSGTTGSAGSVDSGNSLIGSNQDDQIGSGGVTALPSGNYVVVSPNWNFASATDVGAVTFGDGTYGTAKGFVSNSNSLVGSSAGDAVGSGGVVVLSNGNYVVVSPDWSSSKGAVTWGNGSFVGVQGPVNSGNSLVGRYTNDQVGSGGVVALSNGNYVVVSPHWSLTGHSNGAETGAATWGNGTSGSTGTVEDTNSVYGSSTYDTVGSGGVVALSNGNYVVVSPDWTDGTGAVTWASGSSLTSKEVDATNSLVGTATGEHIGSGGVTALIGGHYVVSSPYWSSGRGAATWGDGDTGTAGNVAASNSLIGTAAGDHIGSGGVVALNNGNYVVVSPYWGAEQGAVTWGTSSSTGIVSSGNSLVGTVGGDKVGSGGVTALTNGNYVVLSPDWDAGKGAATLGNGTSGSVGFVRTTNSLVGTTADDLLYATVTPYSDGSFTLNAESWSGSRGAVSWSNGSVWSSGEISAANSLVGVADTASLGVDTVAYKSGLLYAASRSDSGRTGESRSGRVYVGVTFPSLFTYSLAASQDVTIAPSVLTGVLNTGTAVTLQASNDITVSNAITVNNTSGNGGTLTLQAGRSILLNANITTDNGNLTLIANDTTAHGVVDAQRDAGNAVITMGTGATIDAGTGAVSITLADGTGKTNKSSGDITLNSITAGTLTVVNDGTGDGTTNGNIVLNSGTVLSASGTDTPLVLAASGGGNFINNAGSTALSATNGRWLVYSKKPDNDTQGDIGGGEKGEVSYATTPPSSVTDTGNMRLYSDSLITNITFLVGDITITYGDAIPTLTYTTSGLKSGDTLGAVVSGIPTLTTVAHQGSNASTYDILIDMTGVTVNSGYTSIYAVQGTAGTLTIDPKTLTGGGSMTYNGGTTVATSAITLSGIVGQDAVSLTGSGTLVDKNVGTNKTAPGFSLNGTAAGNYTLGLVTVTVVAKSLSLSGMTAVDRVYDGTTTASIGSYGSLSGFLGSDDVTLDNTGSSAAFADKNAGTDKTVTVSGLALSGLDAGNYSIANQTTTANITAKALSLSGLTATNRVYDGTTAASLSSYGTLSGVIGSDGVTLNSGSSSATFANKNAGTNKTVAVTGLALSGLDAGNYSIADQTTTAAITAKALSLSGLTASNRVYDGTTTASVSSYGTLSGVIGTDGVTLNSGSSSAAFADRNAGTGKTVTVGGLALSGSDAGNYSIANQTTTATISPKTLSLSGLTAADRVYDGTTAATISAYGTLSGVIGADQVTLGNGAATASFGDKNVGAGKMVTLTGMALGGADAGNYVVSGQITTASITAKALSADGSRTYDGTTTASAGNLGLSGLVAGDTVSLSGSGSLADKNVGSGKAVNTAGLSLSGGDAGNYMLGSTIMTVTAKTLTASGSRVYDGTTAAAGSTLALAGLVSGDAVSLSGSGSLADKNVGSNKTVNTAGLSLGGGDAGNYILGSSALTVTPATLAVTAANAQKTAGEADPSLSFTALGVLGADTLTEVLRGSLARAAGETVGSYLIGSGTLATNTNYTLAFTGGTFSIAAAPVTAKPTTTTPGTTPGTGTVSVAVPRTTTVIGGTATTTTIGASSISGAGVSVSTGTFAPGQPSGTANNVTSTTANITPPTQVGGSSVVSINVATANGVVPPAGTQVEVSTVIGGVRIVYREDAGIGSGIPTVTSGSGATSVEGTGMAGIVAASSFSTFRADDNPAVAVVVDRDGIADNGLGGQ